MRTQPSRPESKAHGRRQAEGQYHDGADGAAHDEALSAIVAQLTQDQMLVNQALVERILAFEESEAALRASEQTLHELLAHQLANREAERKRISHEIHDSLAQNLLALRMDIVMLFQHTGQRHPRLHDWVGAALDNVDITLRTVKHLLGELRPAGLDLGLAATLEMEARKFTRASGIACQLDIDSAVAGLELDEETMLTLCRGLQEGLNNVFRHSLASRASVRLRVDGGVLDMTLSDNGIGFDTGAPRKYSSYGLLSLEERLATHGGELAVASARAQGTTVTMRLPAVPAASCPAATPDRIK